MTALDNDRLIHLAVEVADLAAEHTHVTKLDAGELAKRRERVERAALGSPLEASTRPSEAGETRDVGRPPQLLVLGPGRASTATVESPVAAVRLLEKGTSLGRFPPERSRRIVGTERRALAGDLVKRYKLGESIRSLAASTGTSYGFVHRVLTESGVKLRQRGGARRRKKA